MEHGAGQGCMLSQLPLNVFFAAVVTVTLRLSADAGILVDLVDLDEGVSPKNLVVTEEASANVMRAVRGMLYAGDVGIASWSRSR